MSTFTIEPLGPVLVSELPPAGPVPPGLVSRWCTAVRQRTAELRFERALRAATPAEYSDLIAASRHQ